MLIVSLAILWITSVQRKEQFTDKCAQFYMCIFVSVSVEYREFTIESSVHRIVCRTTSLSPTGIRTLCPCHTLSLSLSTGIRILYPYRTMSPVYDLSADGNFITRISHVLPSVKHGRNNRLGHLRTDDSTWHIHRVESQYCATRTDNHAAIERDGDSVRQR